MTNFNMDKKEIRNFIRQKKKEMSRTQIERAGALIAENVFALPEYAAADVILSYMAVNQEVLTAPIIEQAIKDGKTVGIPKTFGNRHMEFFAYDEGNLAAGFGGIPEPASSDAPLFFPPADAYPGSASDKPSKCSVSVMPGSAAPAEKPPADAYPEAASERPARCSASVKPGSAAPAEKPAVHGPSAALDTNRASGTSAPSAAKILILVPGLAFGRDMNRIGYGGGFYDTYLENRPYITKAALGYDFQIFSSLPCEPHDIKMDLIITPREIIKNNCTG